MWTGNSRLTGAFGIFAMALALRLGLAIGLQGWLDRQPAPRLCLIEGDADGYWGLAQTLVNGEDFKFYGRSVMRMPGFPAVLAVGQAMFGLHPLGTRCLLATLGALGCLAVYALGTAVSSPKVGTSAAFLSAISPTFNLFSVLLLSESCFALFLTLSLWCAIKSRQDFHRTEKEQSPWRPALWALGSGCASGAATMMRPSWWPYSLVCAIYVAWPIASRVRWQQVISAVLVPLACGLVLAPWAVRNFRLTGHFVPTTLWMGPSLYDGWNPDANGDSNMQFFDQENLLGRMSEYEMDREYSRRAWEWAAQHPRRALELAGIKFLRFWSFVPNARQFQDWPLRLGCAMWFVPVLVLVLLGAWQLRSRWLDLALLVGPVVFFTLLHMMFVGSLRYRLPAEYPLMVLAAYGLHTICGWCCPCKQPVPVEVR